MAVFFMFLTLHSSKLLHGILFYSSHYFFVVTECVFVASSDSKYNSFQEQHIHPFKGMLFLAESLLCFFICIWSADCSLMTIFKLDISHKSGSLFPCSVGEIEVFCTTLLIVLVKLVFLPFFFLSIAVLNCCFSCHHLLCNTWL